MVTATAKGAVGESGPCPGQPYLAGHRQQPRCGGSARRWTTP